MAKTLKDYAAENNMSYSTAYRKYKKNEISGATVVKGDILIDEPVQKQHPNPVTASLMGRAARNFKSIEASSVRENRSANTPSETYRNIESSFVPFNNNSFTKTTSNSCLTAQEVIVLCQKAYYRLSSVRNVINTLKEFSSSKIYLTKGSQKSQEFFETYFQAIGLEAFINEFYLEFWRSANCFVYVLKGRVNDKNLKKLRESMGSTSIKASVNIPVKYIILNPADIIFQGTAFFNEGVYCKVFNQFETARLLNPQTENEKILAQSISLDKKNKTKQSIVELSPDVLVTVFNNKQSYESFGISPIYPVLDDLEFKLELKNMDRAIAKTCQQSVLHVALGYEDKGGNYQFSEEAVAKIEEVFSNGAIGNLLITDFTAKLSFVIPQIGDLLDPKKYEVVNKDIQEGLMDVVFGADDKYSNLATKVKVFVEKIRKAREVFLNQFLVPQMQQICEELGFKQVPVPNFEDIDIEDSIEFYKIITRLAELGVLTPEETFTAFDSGRLPNAEESEVSQTKFKALKDKELYQPLASNVPPDQMPGAVAPAKTGGRPAGSKAPKKSTSVGNVEYENFRQILIKETEFKNKLASSIKEKNKIKSLNKEQLEFITNLADTIILNEKSENWDFSIEKHLNLKETLETEQKTLILNSAKESGISQELAASLYHAAH